MSDAEFVQVLKDLFYGLNGGDRDLIMVPLFKKSDGSIDRRKTVASIGELCR